MLQYDYTKGQLPELIDVIIEEKAKLFVCAIGVPPKEIVEKLHKAGIPVMNVSATHFPSLARHLVPVKVQALRVRDMSRLRATGSVITAVECRTDAYFPLLALRDAD